jgi:hypothetical protein
VETGLIIIGLLYVALAVATIVNLFLQRNRSARPASRGAGPPRGQRP